jgi:hypothetical protein
MPIAIGSTAGAPALDEVRLRLCGVRNRIAALRARPVVALVAVVDERHGHARLAAADADVWNAVRRRAKVGMRGPRAADEVDERIGLRTRGALVISWFHQLSDGNRRRPAKASLSWTSVDVGTVGAGAGVDTGGVVEVVGLVGVSGPAFDPLHAATSVSAAIVRGRTRRNVQSKRQPPAPYQ